MVDQAAIDGFRDGDPEAVRAVYRAYGALVYSVAHAVLGDRSLAEEAAQETFVRAWRAARRFDPSRDLGPWLATIARRVAIDVHRRESARPRRSLDELGEGEPGVLAVADAADRALDVWAVRAAIDELPDEEREVVRLQHLAGLTHPQIAERLDLALGTVKSRSHRAHRRLAARLGLLRE